MVSDDPNLGRRALKPLNQHQERAGQPLVYLYKGAQILGIKDSAK
jgi:hypothetical protein